MQLHERSHEHALPPDGDKITVPYAYAYEVGVSGPTICLFGLKPKTPLHPHLVDFLWPIAKELSYELFPDIPRDKFTWFLGHRYQATEIRFYETQGQLYGMQNSNEFIWTMSKFQSAESFRDLERQMTGKTISDIRDLAYEYDEPGAPPSTPAHPGLAWAAETVHSPTGVTYFKPECQGTEEDKYDFVLVNTQKLLDNIYEHDPEMRSHAERKFYGEDLLLCLDNHKSSNKPIKMPTFVMIRKEDGSVSLKMQSGYAGVLELIRLAEVSFVPIAISKYCSYDSNHKSRKECDPDYKLPSDYGHGHEIEMAELMKQMGIGPRYISAPRSHELGLPPTPRFEM